MNGDVIEVATLPDRKDVLYIDVLDIVYFTAQAMIVEWNAQTVHIDLGDIIVREGRSVFWTPKKNADLEGIKGQDWHIPIPCIEFLTFRKPNSNCIEGMDDFDDDDDDDFDDDDDEQGIDL